MTKSEKVVAFAALLTICYVGIAMVMPMSCFQSPEVAKRSAAVSDMKECAITLRAYASDFDDRYPPTKAWRDRLSPRQVTPLVIDHSPVSTAMNEQLDKAVVSKKPEATVVTFLAPTTDRNFSGGADNLWRQRPEGRSFVCFEDGHARSFTNKEPIELVWHP